MEALGWIAVALSVGFVLAGAVLTVRAMKAASRGRSRPETTLSLEERVSRYVGPIDRRSAALNAPARVAVELLAGLFGFPGLGWMLSGHIAIGLPLLVVVPALAWAFYPMYLGLVPEVGRDPLRALFVLPVVAVVSAGALAFAQYRETVHG